MTTTADLELALSPSFQRACTSLSPRHQAHVNEAIQKLQRGLEGVNLHPLPPYPWHSFGTGHDAHRIICHRDGRSLLLCYVDEHDRAYAWAKRNVPRQIGNAIRIVATDVEEGPSDGDGAVDGRGEEPSGPLAALRDKDFRLFGLSGAAARALRRVPDEDALVDVLYYFPPALGEALLCLATESDDLSAIKNRYDIAEEAAAERREATQLSLTDALAANVNAENLWVVPPGAKALEAALSGELSSWKVFLHPSQKRLVTLNAKGPVKVTGGPGTGKSVVALHRARFLAEHLFVSESRPVLVTTYSRVLAKQLADDLEALCVDAPQIRERIQVLTLAQVAQEILQGVDGPRRLLNDEAVAEAWREAMELDDGERGLSFYVSEREQVALFHGVDSEVDYLKASRVGRKVRLSRKERIGVYKVLSAFNKALMAQGGGDGPLLARSAAGALNRGELASPWCAVVLDELQDASASELRLLAALTVDRSDSGTPKIGPNRLFLVGDGHQRLYARPITLSACGIEVRGRSKKLRLNYRTTQGICSAALDAIEGVELDAVDQDEDTTSSADALRGYRSLRRGERPVQHGFATEQDEAVFVADRAAEGGLLVLARTRAYVDALAERLRGLGLSPLVLAESEAAPPEDGLVLTTLHRAKGLEAPRVVIAGAQKVPARWPGEQAGERALWQRKERALMYVGISRARDWCAVTRVEA